MNEIEFRTCCHRRINEEHHPDCPKYLESSRYRYSASDGMYHRTDCPAKEQVNHPSHYGDADDPYEVIKVCEAWGIDKDAYLFNTIKYIARAGKKDPSALITDLEKAEFYLKRRIARLRNGE